MERVVDRHPGARGPGLGVDHGWGIMLAGTWLVGPSHAARRARAAVAPVAESAWWTYGIMASALLILATFVPLFGRSTGASIVLAVLAAVGIETVRRMIRADVSGGRTRR